MENEDFFTNPPSKPSENKGSENIDKGETRQDDQVTDQNPADFFTYWDQETEHRETKEPTNLDEPEMEDDTQEMGMDEEAVGFAADLAVNANQEGASRLLHYLHGDGEASEYRAKDTNLLHTAWSRFFRMMNIQISKEKGVLWANLLTFGWSFGIGIWKFISRVVSGAFRWPWSKKAEKVEVQQASPSPAPPSPSAAPSPLSADEIPLAEVVEDFPDVPMKACKWDGTPFPAGEGYPVRKSHELYDQFQSQSAHAKWREQLKREARNAEKAEQQDS